MNMDMDFENIMYMIVLIFLVINALFWGLMCHQTHCKVAGYFGMKNCPPHYVHMLMGVVFFLLAIFIAQRKYINTLF